MTEQGAENDINNSPRRKKGVRFVYRMRLVGLSGLIILGIILGRRVSPSGALPPEHSSSQKDCAVCHGQPDSANENLSASLAVETDQTQSELLSIGTGTIYGYGSASSVVQGGSIDFHVSASPGVTAYDIVIFRAGTRNPEPIMTINNLPGTTYECGPVGVEAGQEDADLGCDWPVDYTLNVPFDWPSGIYMAALLDEDDQLGYNHWGSYIHFIVKEDQPGSTASILFQSSTNTWQAYNEFGGWSFYTEPPARRITFDRPYEHCTIGRNTWSTCRIGWEIQLASWLESEGYEVEYAANEDVHTDPTLLFNYTLFVSVGHDEYWSKEMRDNIDAFIDGGGNVAIFSGNTSYRQVRYQEDMRTLVCYKGDYTMDPLYGIDNIRVAANYGDYPVNWPENSTTGLGFRNGGWVNTFSYVGRYTVYRDSHWVYEGTGLQDGDQFWYEPSRDIEVDGALFTWDIGVPVVTGEDQTPLDFVILGLEPATQGHATMGIYTRDGGGTVFNAGTMGWGRGLWPEHNPDDYEVVRQITRNVIDTLSSGDPPPPPIFSIETVSFTYEPTTPLEGSEVIFAASITPAYATRPITYTWQFGDETPTIVTGSSVTSHIFDTSNTYTVTLTASSPYGQSVYSGTVEVAPTYPVESVAFTYEPTTPLEGDEVIFAASITPGYATPPITYTWQFGDETPIIATGSSVISHIFDTSSTYAITLTVSSPYGQSTYSGAVEVAPSYPVESVSFTYEPTSPLEGDEVTFTASFAPAYASPPITYIWQFGDETPIIATGSSVISHIFDTSSTYSVTLTVSSPYGQSTDSQAIEVAPTYPVESASFTYEPTRPLEGDEVAFTASITPAYATRPITYTWQFGDETPIIVTDSGVISHIFDTSNTYSVTLTTSSSYGQRSHSRAIEVAPIRPVESASFSYTPTRPLEGDEVTFAASITPAYATPPITYTWQFRDATPVVVTGSSVISHIFDTSSTYSVTLTASSPYGQSAYSRAIDVTPTYPVESVSFTYEPTSPLEGDEVAFTVIITPAYATPPITYTWQFGVETPITVIDSHVVSYTYEATGTYTASVTAVNLCGKSFYSQKITVETDIAPQRHYLFLPVVTR